MSKLFVRIIARLKGMTVEEFQGPPGDDFRKGVETISDYSKKKGIDPDTLVSRTSTYVEGLANEKQAHALKEFAEREKIELESSLLKRTLEAEVSKKEAEARKEKAEALKSEIDYLDALADLTEKLNKLGVAIVHDGISLAAGPAPSGLDLTKIPGLLPTSKGEEGIPVTNTRLLVDHSFEGADPLLAALHDVQFNQQDKASEMP